MITVHGRTRSEFYSGKSDLEEIAKVKENVKIPVIGNGDIIDEESAENMFKKTNVDGIMIGRGAIGNPWIFERVKYYLKTENKLPNMSLNEKRKIITEHFLLELQEKGEYTGIREFRKHLAYYSKGLGKASEFRKKINTLEKSKDVIECINEYFV